MDKKTFGSIMMALSALYPKYDLQEETLTAYYAILHDLEADLLKAATLEYGSKHKWFPTAAELRQTAFDLIDHSQGKMSPQEAWGKVMKQVGATGQYREPDFDDPMIYRAVEAVGGWRMICRGPEDMIAATRARFLEAFKRFRQDDRTDAAMLPQIREVTKRLSAGDMPALEGGT